MKAIDKWLAGYAASVLRRPRSTGATRHLIFCVADHYEPLRGGTSVEDARRAVKTWAEDFRSLASGQHDSDGKSYKRTLFYPAEEYDEQCVRTLAQLCHDGLAEVEIHLHHRNDTEEGFRSKLIKFRDVLHQRHGLLGVKDGKPAFGFVHGNWALCNSRPDGDWCGVNSELGILRDAGCYADFTFPSAPSPTQPRMVNLIYRAEDTGRPRGADWGERVRERGAVSSEQCTVSSGLRTEGGGQRTEDGGQRSEIRDQRTEDGRQRTEDGRQRTEDGRQKTEDGDQRSEDRGRKSADRRQGAEDGGQRTEARGQKSEVRDQRSEGGPVSDIRYPISDPGSMPRAARALMLITGPLGLNWRNRKWGLLPRLENGEWSRSNPPSACRADLWVKQGIHVAGRPDWIFVKVHTHGMAEGLMERDLLAYLERRYSDGTDWKLHYVSAREMYNIARAAEDGQQGEPGGWRGYEVSSKQ
jgi:hypothetical protein